MKKLLAIFMLFLLAGCGANSTFNLGGVKDGETAYVEILYNGEVIEYFMLTDDLEKELVFEKDTEVDYYYPADKDRNGNTIERDETFRGYNRVVIKDGYVDMVEADCPDQDCVHMKPISKDSWNPNILCAPNRIEVRIVGIDTDIDGIV